jgi:hypothetical protein
VLVLVALYLFVGLLVSIRQDAGRMRARLESLAAHESTDLREGLAAIAASRPPACCATSRQALRSSPPRPSASP